MTRSITQMKPINIASPVPVENGGTGVNSIGDFHTVFNAVRKSELGLPFNSPILDLDGIVPNENLPAIDSQRDELGLIYPSSVVVNSLFRIDISNLDIISRNQLSIEVPNGWYSIFYGIEMSFNTVGIQSFFVNGVEYQIEVREVTTTTILSGPSSGPNGVAVTFNVTHNPVPGYWDMNGAHLDDLNSITFDVFSDSELTNNAQYVLSYPGGGRTEAEIYSGQITFPPGTWYVRARMFFNGNPDIVSNTLVFTSTGTVISDGGGGGTGSENPPTGAILG